jgi:hypothetical protein
MRNFIRLVLTGFIAFYSLPVFAQRPPAIPGLTGSIATDATIKGEQKIANKIAVATEDGVRHLLPAGKDPLSDLSEGATVLIHHGAEVTEGTVSKVNRGDSAVTIRFGNGKTETLELSKDETTTVLEYTDPTTRQKVARYFRVKS